MYNLLVSGNGETWRGEPWVIDQPRCISEYEYTPRVLAEKYGRLGEASVQELIRRPAIFAYEGGLRLDARVGWITRIRHRQNSVRIEYEFETTLPPISSDRLAALSWDLDIGEWELNRTHWALKDVELLPVLVEAGIVSAENVRSQPPQSKIVTQGLTIAAEVEARPRVFRLPAEPPQPNLVSVMMPFEPNFDQVYAAIQDACAEVGMACERADNIWQENEIIQDIFSLIFRSKIVVCDFSGQNPNVFYEAGIAHTLGRHVVPITQRQEDVPFDLRHHRYISYLNNGEGLENLATRLAPRLRTLRDLT